MAERGTISLPAGHQLLVEELWQWKTYTGLLVGLPDDEINKLIVEKAVEKGRTRWGGKPFLLRPTVLLVNYGDPPEAEVAPTLPAIVCLARFEYHPSYSNALRGRPAKQWPAIMATLRTKVLTVVWFQDDFAFPIEPPIYEQILAIDWERCGENKPED
jgi:hypothetical protein